MVDGWLVGRSILDGVFQYGVENDMQCPACQVAFHDREDEWAKSKKRDDKNGDFSWVSILTICPECFHPILRIAKEDRPIDGFYDMRVVYPLKSKEVVVSSEVPEFLAKDFREAVLVLDISAKASAALSRRTLQNILRKNGYDQWHLADQIKALLGETDPDKRLPPHIRETIAAVKEYGNFAAHPKEDKSTFEIIHVEPDEAEWCLEIVEALFHHYYVRPALDSKRFAKLKTKKGRS